MKRILLVEDEPSIRTAVRDALRARGHDLLTHILLLDDASHLAVEPIDDGARRLRRREDAPPHSGIESGNPRFRHRRYVGQQRGSLGP